MSATRIGTYGASQMYISRILAVQERVNNLQVQVSTEKKATAYSGISVDANRLINMENEKSQAAQYIQNNAMADTKLKAANTAIDSITKTIKEFKSRLDDFAQGDTKNTTRIKDIQKFAFDAMVDMQSYLATSVDGQYVFGGGRVNTEPVELPAANLDQFQALYDGADRNYPTTRAAHMMEFTLTKDQTGGSLAIDVAAGTVTGAAGSFSNAAEGGRITIGGGLVPERSFTVRDVDSTGATMKVARLITETTGTATIRWNSNNNEVVPADSGSLTFSPAGDTITAATAGSLSAIAVGTVFTVSGSGSNNGAYEVLSNDGTTITIKGTKLEFVAQTSTETGASLDDGLGNVRGAGDYGTLTFDADDDGALTIRSANAGAFGGVYNAGDTITVSGVNTPAGDAVTNNGQYRILSNDGTTLTVSRVEAGGNYSTTLHTISNESWYKGDTLAINHRVDKDRTVDLGVYASHPGFEKALRAMGLVAQGVVGTDGGLENNQGRVNAARFLLQDAIESPAGGTPPYGEEDTDDLQSLSGQLGVTLSTVKDKNDKHKQFMGFLDTRIIEMENVSLPEAITMLMDDQRALEAGYQALSRVREMSLMDYLR